MQGHPFSFLTSYAPIAVIVAQQTKVSFLLAFPADPHIYLFEAPQSAQSRFFPYCFILLGTPSHHAVTRPVQCCPTSQLVRYASDCKNTRKLTEHMQWYVPLCKGFLTEDLPLKPPQLRGVSGNGSDEDGIHPTVRSIPFRINMHRKHRYAAFKALPSGVLCVVWCVDHCARMMPLFPGHVAALLPGPARQFVLREGASRIWSLCNIQYEHLEHRIVSTRSLVA
ncbi:hypothetical protein BO83DRAFT_402868 [Aspergillus eucalypticola CBS 122712]|uniref:Uncharacterized protein n=1 Tax=Aspergillus eucalypticola (strain CBS 122712 / IBT 29274) TaxID=1448314 RepID=A0A317UQB5_ASPEC|nr:uncharacterized protein BO83DRAFT_402868 [Aspergillus eucalypticola CBS 122712]PWY63755.1 hypothetical protein BO83DRAFT_402868 [Aspergillus eucalypticola CBS 122712]